MKRNFFETLLNKLGEDKDDIEDIYYTGAISDTKKLILFLKLKTNRMNGTITPLTF